MELPSSVTTLEHEGTKYFVIGTAHVSQRSVDEVRQVIAEVKPDVVCVELCKPRHDALTKDSAFRDLDVFKVVREGQTLAFGLAGAPGETALAFASPQSVAILMPFAKGTLCLDPTLWIGPLALGAVPAGGVLNVSVAVPSLPLGVLGAEVFLQGALAGSGGATLTPWAHVTLLDSSL